jgi:hypothetical protein
VVRNDPPSSHHGSCLFVLRNGNEGTKQRRSCEVRFFETKKKALAWAKVHPHFMTVRISTLGDKDGAKLVTATNPRSSPRNIASNAKASRAGRAE